MSDFIFIAGLVIDLLAALILCAAIVQHKLHPNTGRAAPCLIFSVMALAYAPISEAFGFLGVYYFLGAALWANITVGMLMHTSARITGVLMLICLATASMNGIGWWFYENYLPSYIYFAIFCAIYCFAIFTMLAKDIDYGDHLGRIARLKYLRPVRDGYIAGVFMVSRMGGKA